MMYDNDIPHIRTYEQAVAVEESIKPIRGRAIECKPLGKRTKTHINIRKLVHPSLQQTTIIISLYSSDIITFYSDGRMVVNFDRWNSQVTNVVIAGVLGGYIQTTAGIHWYYDGYHDNDPQQLNVDAPTTFIHDGSWVTQDVIPVTCYRLNRKKAHTALKKYSDSLVYMKGVLKLIVNEEGRVERNHEFFKVHNEQSFHKTPEVIPISGYPRYKRKAIKKATIIRDIKNLRSGVDANSARELMSFSMGQCRVPVQAISLANLMSVIRKCMLVYEHTQLKNILVRTKIKSPHSSRDPYSSILRLFEEENHG